MGAAVAGRGSRIDRVHVDRDGRHDDVCGYGRAAVHRHRPIRWSGRGDALIHLHMNSIPATRRTEHAWSPLPAGLRGVVMPKRAAMGAVAGFRRRHRQQRTGCAGGSSQPNSRRRQACGRKAHPIPVLHGMDLSHAWLHQSTVAPEFARQRAIRPLAHASRVRKMSGVDPVCSPWVTDPFRFARETLTQNNHRVRLGLGCG